MIHCLPAFCQRARGQTSRRRSTSNGSQENRTEATLSLPLMTVFGESYSTPESQRKQRRREKLQLHLGFFAHGVARSGDPSSGTNLLPRGSAQKEQEFIPALGPSAGRVPGSAPRITRPTLGDNPGRLITAAQENAGSR
jgi:hypothetical protein